MSKRATHLRVEAEGKKLATAKIVVNSIRLAFALLPSPHRRLSFFLPPAKTPSRKASDAEKRN